MRIISRRCDFCITRLFDMHVNNRCSKQLLRKSAVQCSSEASARNLWRGELEEARGECKSAHDQRRSFSILAKAGTSTGFYSAEAALRRARGSCRKARKTLTLKIIDSSSFLWCSTFSDKCNTEKKFCPTE